MTIDRHICAARDLSKSDPFDTSPRPLKPLHPRDTFIAGPSPIQFRTIRSERGAIERVDEGRRQQVPSLPPFHPQPLWECGFCLTFRHPPPGLQPVLPSLRSSGRRGRKESVTVVSFPSLPPVLPFLPCSSSGCLEGYRIEVEPSWGGAGRGDQASDSERPEAGMGGGGRTGGVEGPKRRGGESHGGGKTMGSSGL